MNRLLLLGKAWNKHSQTHSLIYEGKAFTFLTFIHAKRIVFKDRDHLETERNKEAARANDGGT
ncbi:hypothetical protein C0674_00290 [Sporolactobacillus terrae]|uniref:Uncharacterized protein n=1 Tax=Sporolactobacillus terrae TaxID=269673 RepID=A0ABX5Q3J0_9BACL|nr:hypothetical protein C0674_00290 [Sporolactobacillus terrae]QAA24178.1 hypothetical protein C0679_00270 [Sporolactobacillus terrae]